MSSPAQTSQPAVESGLGPYDALLLVSFGGPEGPEEVMPFLRQVTGGRGIPEERLTEVAQHYLAFGGRSPINDQCRDLLTALRTELDERGLDLPLAWGNRNSEPWLTDTVAQLAADGHRRVLAITTSAYPSYSSCRQYRENLFDAHQALPAGTDLQIDRLRAYAQHPGFVDANVAAVASALDQIDDDVPHLLFVTHSLPTSMAETAGPAPRSGNGSYVDWHLAVARDIVWQLRARTGVQYRHDLVYCSRSGPPSQPWLEPDVNDRLAELAAAGVRSVVVSPIGFVSDHMEVVFDLDTEAAETARSLGLHMVRAATVGTHPEFVSGLVDLALERARVARGEPGPKAVIEGGSPGLETCPADCCPNLRQPGRGALCQGPPVEL